MLIFSLFLFGLAGAHSNKNKYSSEILKILAAQNNLTVHEECSSFSGDCFVVKDFVYYINGEIYVRRHLKPKMNMLGSITIARLATPSLLNSRNLRIQNWPIEKRIIDPNFPSGELFIAIGYISETLSFEIREKQQILLIGLGGGAISNYLSTIPNIEMTVVELDPTVVKIARRFFDHRDLPGTLATFTADGVKFLEKSAQTNKKYKVIMIDATYNGDTTGTGLIGPVKEFIWKTTVSNIFKSLEDEGMAVVNVVSVYSRDQRENETLLAYREIFPSCYFIDFLTVRNKLLVCSKKRNWTWSEEKTRFKKNLNEAIKRLGFKELEYEIQI